MRILWTITLLMLAACSGGNNVLLSEATPEAQAPEFLTIGTAEISLPPDIAGPLNLGLVDLESVGYEQQEFFISGTASAFRNTNELGSDGFWEVEPSALAPYTTRVLVRRPSNPADFNGSVLVEWMNVSAGFDTTPEWDIGHVELLRQGYAWVGVTAQLVGIEGREGAIVPFHLKGFSAERYAATEHPGDSFSYDIFSQVAQAIRAPQATDLLGGLVAQRLIASGESQSAFRLTTYVNAIHPVHNAYDGYLIHSRAEYAAPLAQEPQALISTPPNVFIRTDLNVPVLVFQTETDVLRSSLNSVTVRQDDTDSLRFWEVTGTAHADRYSLGEGNTDIGDDPSAGRVSLLDNIQGFIQCDAPVNSGPMHYVFITAIRGMNNWIIDGTPPPSGDVLEVNDDMSAFVLDDVGNVRGGIRTSYVDAPVAILSGLGQTGESFCGLFGTTVLFTPAEMVAMYIDEAGYVAAVTEATNASVAAGFILPEDAEQIIAWAPGQWALSTSQ